MLRWGYLLKMSYLDYPMTAISPENTKCPKHQNLSVRMVNNFTTISKFVKREIGRSNKLFYASSCGTSWITHDPS